MTYPQEEVCPITFLWRQQDGTNFPSKLWLWIHPAAFEEAWSCLNDAQEKTKSMFYILRLLSVYVYL